MNYTKIKTELIKSTLNLLPPEDGKDYISKNGIISMQYRNGILISMKSRIAFFEGALDSRILKEIGDLPKEYFYAGSIDINEIEFKLGTYAVSLYYKPLGTFVEGFDLWNPSIKWYPCQHDIIEGICSVADVLPSGSNPLIDLDNKAFTLIHIVDGFVIAVANSFRRASCYNISAPSPFNISLSPIGIKQTFGRFKSRKLQRVAQVEILPDANFQHAMAFDFGDVRILVPAVEMNDRTTCDGERGGLVQYGLEDIISRLNNFLAIPCKFLIAIPPDLRKFQVLTKGIQENDQPIAITFMEGSIRLCYETENVSMEDEITIKNYMPKHPITVEANPLDFKNTMIGQPLMGLIDLETDMNEFILYFKNNRLEHLIRAKSN